MPKRIDLTGMRYGRLVVISFVGNTPKNTQWKCMCECTKEVIVFGSNLRHGYTHSCGCLKIETCKANRGIKHPQYGIRGEQTSRWKGGITPENKAIRSSTNYAIWRNSCFARDNYTCQKCGVKGEYLHAHHVQNFSSHKSLRLELSNSVTMCKACHEQFHKTYGNRNNNKMQVIDFTKSFYCQL